MITKLNLVNIQKINRNSTQKESFKNKQDSTLEDNDKLYKLNALETRILLPLPFKGTFGVNDPYRGTWKPQNNNIEEKTVEVRPVKLESLSFDDIGGLPENVKDLLQVKMKGILQHPEVLQQLKLKPVKGLLLSGPPGCGKTLIAKALANSHDMGFISVSPDQVVDKYVGESPKALHKFFESARLKAENERRPCILFFDEIDGIASKRSTDSGSDAKERNSITNQFLQELDGISDNNNVIVLGATNCTNAIDPAIKRPGRLEVIEIPYPNEEGCLEIFNIHAKGRTLDNDVEENKKEITQKMSQNKFSGAEIKNSLDEASWYSLKRTGTIEKMKNTKEKIILTTKEKTLNLEDINKGILSVLNSREISKKEYLE